MKTYTEKIHVWGRIWCSLAIVMFILYPLAASIYYRAWPSGMSLLRGLLGVAPVFWTVGAIEALTFSPMLGSGGSYLGFVTGNLTNLKVPCALSAMEAAKVKPGTEEGELISTISIAGFFHRHHRDYLWWGAPAFPTAASFRIGGSGSRF